MDDQELSLDDALRNELSKVPDEVEDTPEVDEAEDETEAEDTGDADEPEGEAEDSTPESTKDEEKEQPWHIAAVMDEREKRQKYEARVKELEEKIKELTAPKEKEVSVFEDEQAYTKSVMSKAEQAAMQVRFDLSRDFMADLKPDYQEREEAFLELAKSDPTLVAQLQKHPNPAKFAYETAVRAEKMKKLENPEAYEAELEAKIRAKLEAEYAEREEAEESKRKTITPSLAGSRSKGGTKSLGAEPSLEDALFGKY